MKLEWNVYRHSVNSKKIEQFNIFEHGRFLEDVKKDLKKCETKEEFADKLRGNLAYYYWAKCEHEIVISSFPVRIKKEEFGRLNTEFKRDSERYGHEPCSMWVCPDVGEKVDVYEQVRLNWDIFVDYVWSYKRGKKKEKHDA